MIALQPMVHAATGVPAFHEALMRLRRADGALALPAAILPTAEKSGLIQMIDQRVLDLGLKKLREDPDLRIAVNVSGHTLHDPDFFIRLSATLESCQEIAHRLTIELTETCMIDDVEATARAIGRDQEPGRKNRNGRFRRRSHLVQESPPLRIRSGQDRRRFHSKPRPLV